MEGQKRDFITRSGVFISDFDIKAGSFSPVDYIAANVAAGGGLVALFLTRIIYTVYHVARGEL